jgi:hypothetical protein
MPITINGLQRYGRERSIFTKAERDARLQGFHHREIFDEKKSYEFVVTKDFGHGYKKYEQYLMVMRIVADNFYDGKTCIILNEVKESEYMVEKYVIVNEKMDDAQLEALVPYCRCCMCASPFPMMGYVHGSICNHGDYCDEGPKVDQPSIDESRAFKEANPHFLLRQRMYRTTIAGILILLLYLGWAAFTYLLSVPPFKK